jgi:hypothetical protein
MMVTTILEKSEVGCTFSSRKAVRNDGPCGEALLLIISAVVPRVHGTVLVVLTARVIDAIWSEKLRT